MPEAQAVDADIERHLAATRAARLESYREFLRIPSISALPEHAGDVRAAAAWLADRLVELGFEHVAVMETGGHPVVYGDWLHAEGAPTVVVYGHYDVQPVDPLDLWTRPPFEPFVDGERMLGRGAADDKGQVHMHLMAVQALLATRGRLPLNVRFVLEGEEESGSFHLDAWLEANRDLLAGDVAVISDSGFFEGNLPAITIGLRGLMYAQIDVHGTKVDVHSGSYGGAIENPGFAIARIIAGLKDGDGRILVPGFYDEVIPLSERDREAFAELPFDEEAWRQAVGAAGLHGEAGYTTLERRGGRPTLDVNGIWGGFQGDGSKTIIPAHAHAKVSCRLVADQDPDRIYEAFRAFVLELAPPGVRVEVRKISTGRGLLTPIDHPATQAAARAIEATFGRPPLYHREGGSIPVAASFGRILRLPVSLVGFTQPDDNAHAPDEWMDLRNYETGIRCIARMWDEIARTELPERG